MTKLETFKFFVGWLGRNLSKNAESYERAVLNWEDDHGNTVLHIAVSKKMKPRQAHSTNIYSVLSSYE